MCQQHTKIRSQTAVIDRDGARRSLRYLLGLQLLVTRSKRICLGKGRECTYLRRKVCLICHLQGRQKETGAWKKNCSRSTSRVLHFHAVPPLLRSCKDLCCHLPIPLLHNETCNLPVLESVKQELVVAFVMSTPAVASTTPKGAFVLPLLLCYSLVVKIQPNDPAYAW